MASSPIKINHDEYKILNPRETFLHENKYKFTKPFKFSSFVTDKERLKDFQKAKEEDIKYQKHNIESYYQNSKNANIIADTLSYHLTPRSITQ